jgi:hypothetical protein
MIRPGAKTWVLAAAVALLTLPPAAAQTSKETPGRVTPDRATSACLGNATSPTCAAETLLACLTRGDTALCRTINVAAPPRPASEMQAEYVVERVSVIRQEDVTDDLRDVEWFKPGYTLIEAQRRTCQASHDTCGEENWEDLQVYLRPRPGSAPALWDVIYWRSESEPDVPQELLDDATRKAP